MCESTVSGTGVTVPSMDHRTYAIVAGSQRRPGKVRLSRLDTLTGHVNVYGGYVFQGRPDIERLKRSLAATLDVHPDFAGTLMSGGTEVLLSRNNRGAGFSVSHSDRLWDAGPGVCSINRAGGFALKYLAHRYGIGSDLPLVSFQVVVFRNGCYAIAFRYVSSLADTIGFSRFMRCWSHCYNSGAALGADRCSRRLVDRLLADCGGDIEALQVPASTAAGHEAYRIFCRRTFVPGRELAARFPEHGGALPATEWISAALWQAFARSLDQDGGAPCQLVTFADQRRSPRFRVPQSFTGNATLERRLTLSRARLLEKALPDLAALLAGGVSPAEVARCLGQQPGSSCSAGVLPAPGRGGRPVHRLMVRDMRDLHDLPDFGSGPPLWFDPGGDFGADVSALYGNQRRLVIRYFAGGSQLEVFMAALRDNLAALGFRVEGIPRAADTGLERVVCRS